MRCGCYAVVQRKTIKIYGKSTADRARIGPVFFTRQECNKPINLSND